MFRLESTPNQLELDIKIKKRGNPNFKPIWQNETKVIRVPKIYAEKCKELCKDWELGNDSTPSTPSNSAIAELPASAINLDPQRFQYKIVHNSNSGSTGSLNTVTQWNGDLAGLILVWLDPSNGLTYCINGHNRLSLAKKLGINNVAVRYINASTAKQARIIGAMANIGDGKGTVLDGAKLIREAGLTSHDLKSYGINLSDSIASKAIAIANLTAVLFDRVISGELEINIAAVIGDLEDQDQQLALWELIKSKSNITQETLSELVETVKHSNSITSTTSTLFGLETFSESLAIERAELQAYITKTLRKRSRLFNLASKRSNAEILAAAGNEIDTTSSKDNHSRSVSELDLFNQFKNLSGEISDTINDYAAKLKGKNKAAIKQQCLTAITTILESHITSNDNSLLIA